MAGEKVLTLKYRPQTFDELLIQDHVRNTLKKAIQRNRLANAYLFAGPRGVGKTTTARILAKSLNCLSFEKPTVSPCNKCSACIEIAESRSMDVLEIDGASNRGIDQVRELRENTKYSPTSLRYKVYIIDEVHMLTPEAFNALLKTLEEPPAHVKFILATTAINKVPLTIISRCQRFDFRKATPAEIVQRLNDIATKENIKITQEALVAIARRADGAIRDAEGLLEQLFTYSPEGIELSHAEELLGIVPANLFFEYADIILSKDARALIEFIDRLFTSGHDYLEFYTGAIMHFRNLLLAQLKSIPPELGLLPEEKTRLEKQAEQFPHAALMEILRILSNNESNARHSQFPKLLLEFLSLELLEAPPGKNQNSSQSVLERNDLKPEETTSSLKSLAPPDTLWTQLCSAIETKKSSLGRLLCLGKPVSSDTSSFTVAFPPEHKGIIVQLQRYKKDIESALKEITGKTIEFRLVIAETEQGTDQITQRLTKHFGEIEER